MNTDRLHERLSPGEFAALLDTAKAQAMVLRAEALDALPSLLARSARAAWCSIRRGVPASTVRPAPESVTCRR